MSDIYSSIGITSVAATVTRLMGIAPGADMAEADPLILALAEKKQCAPVDRVVLYNPDAVGLWLYQKYTDLFVDAAVCSDLAIPKHSEMPSVTPVCFASMYTGTVPAVHGIRKYEKPVLSQETIFDVLIRAGKRLAIVSEENASISRIFLEREMDYYIYSTVKEVNEKALALMDEDRYDLIVIYNGNYDSIMHKNGPEAAVSLQALSDNVSFYRTMVEKIHRDWTQHRVFYGFLPDHGCHEIDGDCGSHGLDMQEDMNVIHFYGLKDKE